MKGIFKTDCGIIRHHNEDSGDVLINQYGQCLAIVADGMGGHNAGEVASGMALQEMNKRWQAVDSFETPDSAEQWLESNVTEINTLLFNHSLTHEECKGMGTTIVAAIVTENFATIVNIGDSRCYLLNDIGFKQITEDHSYVNELIKLGELSPEEAEMHPRKNLLLKVLGTEPSTDMDITTISFEEGDKLLLCSDGLSNKVSSDEMNEILISNLELEEMANKFIQLANENGGEDNISLAIIESTIEGGDDE